MIPVKIDLEGKVLYVSLEEYLRKRELYDNLLIKATGKCGTKDIPYIELDKNYQYD